jgi:UTP--glucose-1-phosphate uridylyltransferase
MIKKVVIPSAGLGTRLLPATKEQPKEMLPIFTRDGCNKLCVKPLLQVVFENLHYAGCQEYYFITGRSKRSIEDYFTIDNEFLNYNRARNNHEHIKELAEFYDKIRKSNIVFINQPEPKGFGDAVYHAKRSTGSDSFLVHAGDDLIISAGNGNKNSSLLNLVRVFEEKEAAAAFCVEKAKDPSKYGVIIPEKIGNKVYRVRGVVEKPAVPPSNMAIVAIYAFTPHIYKALEETLPDQKGEVQLTNAIQRLIDQGFPVYAVEMDSAEKRIDIGNPTSYLAALKLLAKSQREPVKQPLLATAPC